MLSDPTPAMSVEFQKTDPIKIGEGALAAYQIEIAAQSDSGPTSESTPPPLVSNSVTFWLRCRG